VGVDSCSAPAWISDSILGIPAGAPAASGDLCV